jgi:hypothetical protein
MLCELFPRMRTSAQAFQRIASFAGAHRTRSGRQPYHRAIPPGRATSPPQFVPRRSTACTIRGWSDLESVGNGSRTELGHQAASRLPEWVTREDASGVVSYERYSTPMCRASAAVATAGTAAPCAADNRMPSDAAEPATSGAPRWHRSPRFEAAGWSCWQGRPRISRV